MDEDETAGGSAGPGPSAEQAVRVWHRFIRPDRFGVLLIVVFVSFVTVPIVADRGWGTAAVGIQAAIVVLLALEASGVSPRWIAASAVAVVLTTVVLVSEAALRTGAPPAWPSAVLTVLLASTPFLVLRRVVSQPRVTVASIAGALSAYLLIGLAFGALFQTISLVDSDAFSQPLGPAASYFSFVTLVTLGYGDIVPVSNFARSMATLEAVLGQVLLVTLVARSVSTLGQDRPERPQRAERQERPAR